VNQSVSVELAQRGGKSGSHAKHESDVERHAHPRSERLTPGILKKECRPSFAGRQRDGPYCPHRIQLFTQRVLVLEHADNARLRMLLTRDDDEG